MSSKLFVGSLPYSTTDDELKDLFAGFGNVESAVVIKDRESGRSKGFGFVEFSTKEEADAAIADMNGKEVEGRKLTVNHARPKEDRGPRGGGFDRPRY